MYTSHRRCQIWTYEYDIRHRWRRGKVLTAATVAQATVLAAQPPWVLRQAWECIYLTAVVASRLMGTQVGIVGKVATSPAHLAGSSTKLVASWLIGFS